MSAIEVNYWRILFQQVNFQCLVLGSWTSSFRSVMELSKVPLNFCCGRKSYLPLDYHLSTISSCEFGWAKPCPLDSKERSAVNFTRFTLKFYTRTDVLQLLPKYHPPRHCPHGLDPTLAHETLQEPMSSNPLLCKKKNSDNLRKKSCVLVCDLPRI